jgi:hypothetical protein
MINKLNLKEGAYYIGTCRNTNIAKWFNGKFVFINRNFNELYVETIPYFGDVKKENSDGFIPIEEIKINFDNISEEKNIQDYKNYARKIYLNLSSEDLTNEIWKEIPNYEGLYYVSNLGRIKKYDNNKIMRQNFCREYLVVGLTDYNRKRNTCRVHRLVALTFKKNNDDTLEVNHINGIKTDNREINLEWISHSENSKHTYISGNKIKKLTPEMVVDIKKMLNKGEIQKNIAKKYNVACSTICEINKNKKWTNI